MQFVRYSDESGIWVFGWLLYLDGFCIWMAALLSKSEKLLTFCDEATWTLHLSLIGSPSKTTWCSVGSSWKRPTGRRLSLAKSPHLDKKRFQAFIKIIQKPFHSAIRWSPEYQAPKSKHSLFCTHSASGIWMVKDAVLCFYYLKNKLAFDLSAGLNMWLSGPFKFRTSQVFRWSLYTMRSRTK